MNEHFGKYVEVTEFAKQHNPEFKTYERIFVCRDTHDYWIAMINKDVNEDFETQEGTWLIERNKISNYGIRSHRRAVIKHADEGFEGWDSYEADSLEEALEVIDGCHGVILEDGTEVEFNGETIDGFPKKSKAVAQ